MALWEGRGGDGGNRRRGEGGEGGGEMRWWKRGGTHSMHRNSGTSLGHLFYSSRRQKQKHEDDDCLLQSIKGKCTFLILPV